MRQTILRVGLTLALVSACGGESHTHTAPSATNERSIAPEKRYRVDLLADDHGLGGDSPLVTVVLYADYACPPCARTWTVLDNLIEDYGEDLRVVSRSMTAPGFSAGEEAAEAVMAAGAQGAFWPLHRRFFASPPTDRRAIEAAAKELGLDLTRLRDELDTGAYTGPRLRHRRQALELGVAFGPVAFVNGRPVVGYHDEASWHALIDHELEVAKAKIAAGTPRGEVYAALVADGAVEAIALEGEAAAARDALIAKLPPPVELAFGPEPEEGTRFQAPLGGAVYAGPDDAPVVLVAYMDAACPFCRRSLETSFAELLERYSEDLRLEIRHLPLPIHPAAEGAARASIAAGRQGQFAAFYRELVTGEERKLSRDRFLAIAESLGLDRERFLADLGDSEVIAAVSEERAQALRAGIQATPSLFVNGRFFSGHRSTDALAAVIDEELALAKVKAEEGLARAEIAAALIGEGIPLPDSKAEAEAAEADATKGASPPQDTPSGAARTGEEPDDPPPPSP